MEAAIFLSLATILGVSVGLVDVFGNDTPVEEDETVSTDEDTDVSEDDTDPADDNIPVARNDTASTDDDIPLAEDDTAETTEDTAVSIDVLGNDSDPDGDPLTVTAASAPNGSVTVEDDNSLTYTPNAGFTGPDTITYEISDGAGGTATASVAMSVAAANSAPLAEDDTAETTQDTAVSIDVLGNDSDPDGDPLSVTAASAPNGSVTVEDDNSLTYTPNAGFTGPDTITYEIRDGAGGTATASVAMSVAAANSAPLAEDDTAETTWDTAVSIDVLGNDSDPDGDPLSVTAASAPNGSVTVEDDNSLTYTPNAGFTGPDTITYEISDGAGGTATASVAMSVAAANSAPLAEDDTAETTEDTAVSIDVLGNDSDPDGDPLSVTTASAPNGSVTVEDDNSLTYTPNAGFTGPDTITYEISDGAGGTATASVAMSVAAANSAPLAEDDTAETTEDTAVSIDVLGNDSDPDGDPLSVTTASAPNGSVTVEDDNSLTYTPNAGFTGPDTITYEISDGAGGTATASVAMSVAAANSAPLAEDDTAETTEDTAVSIDVLGNDSDPDGDPLSVTTASAPNGSVTVEDDNSLTYTPNAGFTGPDTITYEISDGAGGTATASVAMSVAAANSAPLAEDDTAETTEDTAVSIDVLGNDSDPDGDPLTVTAASAPNGSVTVEDDNSLT